MQEVIEKNKTLKIDTVIGIGPQKESSISMFEAGGDIVLSVPSTIGITQDLQLTLFQKLILVDYKSEQEDPDKIAYVLDLPRLVDLSRISYTQRERYVQFHLPGVNLETEQQRSDPVLITFEGTKPIYASLQEETNFEKEQPIEIMANSWKQDKDANFVANMFSPEVIAEAQAFHQQIPGFAPTPLHNLNGLAKQLGLGGIWVKDESRRLNLNAFKVLGGSYAVAKVLQRKLGEEDKPLSFSRLKAENTRELLGDLVFSAATDGNHGRGVAWMATRLGYPCIIYVHKLTSAARIKAIEECGARVVVIDGNYDDAVRRINQDSDKNGWQVISDTAWDGYEQVPAWVMQGYATMFAEAQAQLQAQGVEHPTHILVQAGVGSLAGSMVGFYTALLQQERPTFFVVEPTLAPCLFHSNRIGDGFPHSVYGDLDTIMAGLACGDPNPLGWKILRDWADQFVQCPDYVAALGMRAYRTPLENDPAVISGESGALTLGALIFLMRWGKTAHLREKYNFGPDAHILLVNSEGDTDPQNYRNVVWGGAHAVPGEALQIFKTSLA